MKISSFCHRVGQLPTSESVSLNLKPWARAACDPEPRSG